MKVFRSKGYTLLELLITLAIFSCLVIFGSGASSEWVKNNQNQLLLDELQVALQYAKLQAMVKKEDLIIVPLSMDHDWAKGMVLKSKDKILQQWQWTFLGCHLHWVGISGEKSLYISNHPQNAMGNGRFTMTDSHGVKRWSLIVNRMGRVRAE